MFPKLSPLPQTGLDALAQAWLGAGATAVSIWDRHRLIRQWRCQTPLDAPDFVVPVRLGKNGFGEMHITGFSAPGWSRWHSASTLATSGPDCSDSHVREGPSPTLLDPPAKLRGLDVFAASHAALEVGGDYYDFVHEPSGSLAFSVADVAGKGLGAAMFVPDMHRVLRDSLQSTLGSAPHNVLKQLNKNIYPLFATTDRFATALLGCYDPDTRLVSYANAGHSPVIYRTAAGQMYLLRADTVPLGVQRNTTPVKQCIGLNPGDILLVATDGITEAKSRNGQMFGHKRLMALIDTLAHHTARSIVRTLFQQVAAFAGREVQNDDQTIMVLKGAD